MSAGKLNATKRFAVRMSLVTGSTLATIIGAQSLALLDEQAFSTLLTPEAVNVAPQTTNDTFGAALTATPSITATSDPIAAAPNIAILRRPGQIAPVSAPTTAPAAASAQAVQSAPVQIAPPAPAQIAPPAPVVVQAPAPVVVQQAAPAPAPVTRSSRR